jgi:hypothetical protein
MPRPHGGRRLLEYRHIITQEFARYEVERRRSLLGIGFEELLKDFL